MCILTRGREDISDRSIQLDRLRRTGSHGQGWTGDDLSRAVLCSTGSPATTVQFAFPKNTEPSSQARSSTPFFSVRRGVPPGLRPPETCRTLVSTLEVVARLVFS